MQFTRENVEVIVNLTKTTVGCLEQLGKVASVVTGGKGQVVSAIAAATMETVTALQPAILELADMADDMHTRAALRQLDDMLANLSKRPDLPTS